MLYNWIGSQGDCTPLYTIYATLRQNEYLSRSTYILSERIPSLDNVYYPRKEDLYKGSLEDGIIQKSQKEYVDLLSNAVTTADPDIVISGHLCPVDCMGSAVSSQTIFELLCNKGKANIFMLTQCLWPPELSWFRIQERFEALTAGHVLNNENFFWIVTLEEKRKREVLSKENAESSGYHIIYMNDPITLTPEGIELLEYEGVVIGPITQPFKPIDEKSQTHWLSELNAFVNSANADKRKIVFIGSSSYDTGFKGQRQHIDRLFLLVRGQFPVDQFSIITVGNGAGSDEENLLRIPTHALPLQIIYNQADAVFHWGGAGAMMDAIHAHVPQFISPRTCVDQMFNGRWIQEHGLGQLLPVRVKYQIPVTEAETEHDRAAAEKDTNHIHYLLKSMRKAFDSLVSDPDINARVKTRIKTMSETMLEYRMARNDGRSNAQVTLDYILERSEIRFSSEDYQMKLRPKNLLPQRRK